MVRVTASTIWLSVDYLNQLIDHWYRRAVGDDVVFDTFDRFVSLWIAFNAWGSYVFGKDNDRSMLEDAKKDQRLTDSFGRLLQEQSFVHELEAMKANCPVGRNRPYRGQDTATITDVTNFSEVLEVVYVVRCNLLHGEKSFGDTRDRALVSGAFEILKRVFEGVRPVLT